MLFKEPKTALLGATVDRDHLTTRHAHGLTLLSIAHKLTHFIGQATLL